MKELLVFYSDDGYEDDFPYRNITFVHSLQAAMREIEMSQYAMVMIRLDCEEKNAIRFAEMVRGVPGYSYVPIVIVAKDDRYERWAYRDIHCHEYLVMPLSKQDVIRIIFLYVTLGQEAHRQEHVVVKEKKGVSYIPTSDILYMTSLNRKVQIVTIESTHVMPYVALEDIGRQYGKYFVRCHRSMLVNRIWIERINYSQGYLIVKGEKLPMGRGFYEGMKRACEQ